MYLSHFKLRRRPFDINPDPDFLWLGEKHTEALSKLKHGIQENKGFLLLTGDAGSGKTALINLLVRTTDGAAIIATVQDPGLEPIDFFNFLSEGFKMDRRFTSKGDFLIEFKQFLLKACSAQQKVLLIIDEAQRLNPEMLEQIRLLSNIELSNRKLINIFLIGQTEFNRTLLDERSKAVRQRITISYHIEPLTEIETAQYIRHRLKVAGARREIYSPDALKRIHVVTGGHPRLINIVCDHALITSFANGSDAVGSQDIEECCKELRITIAKGAAEHKKPAPIANTDRGARLALPLSPTPRGWGERWLRAGVMCTLAALLLWGGLRGVLSLVADGSDGTEASRPSSAEKMGARQPITDQEPQGAPTQPRASSAGAERAMAGAIPDSPQGTTATTPETLVWPQDIRAQPAPPSQSPAPPPSAALAPSEAHNASPEVRTSQHQKSGAITAKEFTLNFEGSSFELPVNADELLSEIESLLKSAPRTRAVIEGHTDSIGDPSSNRVVSYARAAGIRDYLLDRGIEPRRLKIFAIGAERPVDSNFTPEGRSKNNRVVARVFAETTQ